MPSSTHIVNRTIVCKNSRVRMINSLAFAVVVGGISILWLSGVDVLHFPPKSNEVGILHAQRILSGTVQKTLDGRPPRIAVGWNANLDAVVNASALFQSWDVALPREGSDRLDVKSVADFLSAFLYHVRLSTAAERFITSRSAFNEIVTATSRTKPVFRVGGNAALIATELKRNGCVVTLAGRVGQQLRSKLADDMEIVNSIEDLKDASDEVWCSR